MPLHQGEVPKPSWLLYTGMKTHFEDPYPHLLSKEAAARSFLGMLLQSSLCTINSAQPTLEVPLVSSPCAISIVQVAQQKQENKMCQVCDSMQLSHVCAFMYDSVTLSEMAIAVEIKC